MKSQEKWRKSMFWNTWVLARLCHIYTVVRPFSLQILAVLEHGTAVCVLQSIFIIELLEFSH